MRRFFISGGTGLVGRAIVRQLIKCDDVTEIWLLTRNAQRRYEMLSWSHKVKLYEGDITETDFPQSGFTDLIHGANEVNDLRQPDHHRYYYTIVEGTARIMDWARAMMIDRVLLLSSGAATRDTVYGRAKRQCERISREGRPAKVARIYSVLGEDMPLNGQYAAGVFVHQALNDGVVRYYGGTSERSYLNVEDCARWLLTILAKGDTHTAYDVAGEKSIPIYFLAHLVADVFGVKCEKIEGPTRKDSYIPNLGPAQSLGLRQEISIRQSLERIKKHYESLTDLRHSHLEKTGTS